MGGAGSELGGGHFKDGFVGAFFAATVNPLIKAIKSVEMKGALRTLAGGTASRLGGGKFASGATSAAMGFLFNDVLHEDGGGGSAAQEKPPAFMDDPGVQLDLEQARVDSNPNAPEVPRECT